MRLHLAPMEGVVDWVMRDLLTRIGGIDQCTTEFIRVTNLKLPDAQFYKYCPELNTFSKTQAGVPVFVQLLGGQPGPLVENAYRVYELGALGVDFNFGCPAKTVNRHDGGATLLKTPERLYRILKMAREALPESFPVTAKIRLGYDDPSRCVDLAQAVEAAGIKTLTVHCRTKMDMYKPPAYWEWIARIKEKVKLKIIANGEINTVQDLKRCQEVTGCEEFMIGRGAIKNPFLFLQIKALGELDQPWFRQKALLVDFFEGSRQFRDESYAIARTKQWMSQLSKSSEEAHSAFQKLKTIRVSEEFKNQLIAL